MQPPKKKSKFAHDDVENAPMTDHTATAGQRPSTKSDDTTADIEAPSKEKTKHAARGKVLGTIELLEAILLGLDTKTLLLSQRVSKTFKSTITDSLTIQQALFLKPSSTMAPVWNDFCFPPGHNVYFRGASKVSFVDISAHPQWNNSNRSLKTPHNLDYSLWYWNHGKSAECEKRTPELWPMLIRQPAIALKLDVECSMCDSSSQWTLEAAATFGDLVHYLENEIECDCRPISDDDYDEWDTSED